MIDYVEELITQIKGMNTMLHHENIKVKLRGMKTVTTAIVNDLQDGIDGAIKSGVGVNVGILKYAQGRWKEVLNLIERKE